MEPKQKISGLMLTKNNKKTIKQSILSILPLISELIIIDDNSTDNTLEIIKEIYPKSKIYKRKLNKDFAGQRNFALSKAKHNWALFIDSDEALTKGLQKEILETLKNPKHKAYVSRRDSKIFKHWHEGNSGRPILLKKDIKFHGYVHENTKGQKGKLKKILYHFEEFTMEKWLDKINLYAQIDAKNWINQKRNFSNLQIIAIATIMPIIMFFKWYIKNKYYKDGINGFLFSILSSTNWTKKMMIYYNMKNKEKRVQGTHT
jgi:glycosyltransferase involved in cell wall biosynthesis